MTKLILHICNPSTPEHPGCTNIVSKKELDAIEGDSYAVYLLNVHLNWEGNKLSNNYGFSIANLIRTEKKSKAPVIFYSPIQVAYFEHKSLKETKYKILFGRGSAFIEAPFKEAALHKLSNGIAPLSKAALHDITTMLCDLKGIVIDKLNHDLKFGIADIDKVMASVAPYLSSFQKKLIDFDKFVTAIKAANSADSFNIVKRQFILLCSDKLTEKGKDDPLKRNVQYKVLVLDDVQEEIKKAKENLQEQFIIEEASNAEQAIRLLEKDIKNEIVAVIADWRLFTNEKQNYWQPVQGYEVLDFAAKNGIRSLFALTSQADFIVHDIRNLMGIRLSLFKKENLNTSGQWKTFADALFEACIAAKQVISNIPDSENWKKTERAIDDAERKRIKKNNPERTIHKKLSKNNEVFYVSYTSLHDQYLASHNSHNWQAFFKKIDDKADEIWKYLRKFYKKNETYNDVDILRDKFDIETPKDSLLFPVLVLRRIWLALWYSHVDNNKTLSQDEIKNHSNFIYAVINARGFAAAAGNSHAAEQTKLCITIHQVRNKQLLPEENAWLIKCGLFDWDE